MTVLEQRLADLVRLGGEFTADDLTDEGALVIDPAHQPNGKQNGIGALIRSWSTKGYIVSTGRVVPSRAPHRKGGMIQVWQSTAAGRAAVQP